MLSFIISGSLLSYSLVIKNSRDSKIWQKKKNFIVWTIKGYIAKEYSSTSWKCAPQKTTSFCHLQIFSLPADYQCQYLHPDKENISPQNQDNWTLWPGTSTWRWRCPRWGCAGRSSDSGQSSCSSWCRWTFSLQAFQINLDREQKWTNLCCVSPSCSCTWGQGWRGKGRATSCWWSLSSSSCSLGPCSWFSCHLELRNTSSHHSSSCTNLWGTAAAVGTVASAGPRWACPRGRPRCGERSPSPAWTGQRGRCSTCWCPSSWVVKYNKEPLSLLEST